MHGAVDGMRHVAALTTVSDVGHAKTQRADLAAAQQIFIKAQSVARNSGCQSCYAINCFSAEVSNPISAGFSFVWLFFFFCTM